MSQQDARIQPRERGDQLWLEAFIAREGGVAGTVHRVRGEDLHLAAAVNIPPPVLAAVAVVPRGKGMAGLAQLRRQPVQTCDLKTDDSGQVRPLAKTVAGRAAIAIPVMDGQGAVRAVVGISFGFDGDVPPETQRALEASLTTLP